ncbi:unnamed protein product [Lymnaea stagnalis]|uniref:THD domain-containing protein n=1 Tax=Lymnaea stagnalis TaxID=6523 RepID=A0AAV2HFP3_LYMST
MPRRNRLAKWNIASCLVGVLSLLLNLVCVAFVAYRLRFLLAAPPASNVQSTKEVCIECPGAGNFQREDIAYNNKSGECCAHSVEGLFGLMNMGLSQRDQAIERLKFFSETSGHFQLIPDSSNDTNDKVLRMEMQKQGSHSQSLAVDANGFVNIGSGGSYFVYCSVYFRANSSRPCPTSNPEHMTWTLSVKRKSGTNSEMSMMEAVHTCCENCIRERATSYAAGVFQLNASDVVKVMVSGKGVIYFDERSSYLGLMMLNSGREI